MPLNAAEFWRLVEQSQLLSKSRCEELARAYAANGHGGGHVGGEAASDVADWLCGKKEITAYHRTVLLAGRAGPFVYGPYRVENKLAGPGRKNWFQGRHSESGQSVLLQFASGPLLKDPALWRAVTSRAKRIAKLHADGGETHLAGVIDAVDLAAYKFLVYREMTGAALADQLRPGERMNVGEACRAAGQAALALATMHEAGAVHGEVSPATMWRETSESFQLLVASQESPANEIDPADYLAPELARPGAAPDALADIYALGCTLYQLLAGKPPFAGDNRESKLKRHAAERIAPLEEWGVPAPLAKHVTYMMAKRASLRTASARTVAGQLAEFAPPPRGAPKTNAMLAPAYEAWLKRNAFTTLDRAPPCPTASPPPIPAIAPVRATTQAPPVSPPLPVPGTGARPAPVIVATEGKGKSKRQQRQTIVLALAGLATIVTSVVVVVALSGKGAGKTSAGGADSKTSGEKATSTQGSTKQTVAANESSAAGGNSAGGKKPAAATAFQQQVVADDGKRLWASPTEGAAVDRRFLPPDAQVFLFMRPAKILADAEGKRALEALGPDFAAARAAWEAAAGVVWEELDSLAVTLHANGENPPRVCTLATLAAEHAPLVWAEKWGNPTSVKIEEPAEGTGPREARAKEFFQRGPWCYFAPPAAEGRTIVVGAKEEVEAVASGQPAPARREVEQLLRYADRERDFTAVFAPNFFFGDGRKLFAGEYAKILEPLSWFLGDGLKAGLVSMHLSDELYVEMRLVAEIGLDEYNLSSQVQSRLADMPDKIDNYVAAVDPPAYWRKVAFRYPRMIHLLNQQTRIGAESDQAVLNAVLPKVAAHNLLAASEVVLATAPGAGVAAAGTPAGPSAPKTIDEAMKAKISLAFPAQSLEFAMQDVATAVKEAYPTMPIEFRVKIIGADLEKDGITRNQQVRNLEERDKSVAEVLTAMVMKANPVTTVKAPNEADQKLVWVIADDPDNAGQKAVLITTRDAAATKGYDLPSIFK